MFIILLNMCTVFNCFLHVGFKHQKPNNTVFVLSNEITLMILLNPRMLTFAVPKH